MVLGSLLLSCWAALIRLVSIWTIMGVLPLLVLLTRALLWLLSLMVWIRRVFTCRILVKAWSLDRMRWINLFRVGFAILLVLVVRPRSVVVRLVVLTWHLWVMPCRVLVRSCWWCLN